jgi:hypothetical protein
MRPAHRQESSLVNREIESITEHFEELDRQHLTHACRIVLISPHRPLSTAAKDMFLMCISAHRIQYVCLTCLLHNRNETHHTAHKSMNSIDEQFCLFAVLHKFAAMPSL